MTTTTVQAMRFEVGADINPLKTALAEAAQQWKQLADTIKEQFKEATVTISDAVAKGIAETGGIQGAVEGAFAGASNAVSGFVKAALGLIPGMWGKLAAGVYTAFEGPVNSAIESVKQKLADLALAAIDKREEMIAALGADATSNPFAKFFNSKLGEVRTGVETVKLGGGFEAAQADIEKRLSDEQKEIELLGKTAAEVFKLRTEWAILQAVGVKTIAELNDFQREALDVLLKTGTAKATANDEAKTAFADDNERARAITAITSALQRQTEMELANADAITKSAGARARERGEAQARGYGRRGTGKDVLADPAVQAGLDAREAGADKSAIISFNTELAQQIKLQSANYDVLTRSLGATAGETARLKFVQSEQISAERMGVVVTDELRESINSAGQAVGAAAQRAAEAQQAFKNFMDVGRSVAGSLESSFDKWISGTRFNFKALINDMARDIAKLEFRQALTPIFGGGAGGSLFGSLASLFTPRAGGGPVSSGSPYMVGEHGAELFVPRSAGTIVPNGAMGGGGSAHITYTVNVSGAMGREEMAAIAVQTSRAAFQEAQRSSRASTLANSRQARMLEG